MRWTRPAPLAFGVLLGALAAQQRVAVKHVPVDVLTRQARNGVHQGVVADVEETAAYSVEDLVNGLHSVGATARDVVAILQAIKAAGGLRAELEVL